MKRLQACIPPEAQVPRYFVIEQHLVVDRYQGRPPPDEKLNCVNSRTVFLLLHKVLLYHVRSVRSNH